MVIDTSSPDEPEPASAAPELRGSVLDVLRTMLGDHQERDTVLSIVGQLVARNTDLERRVARLGARFKPSEQVSTAQLMLFLDALKRRPEPPGPDGETTDDHAALASQRARGPHAGPLAGVELAERIDRSQRRGEVDLTSPGEHLRGRAKSSPRHVVAHGPIKLEQDLKQPRHVLRRSSVDDVEVGGRDRRALQHRSNTADDDELHSRVAERRE